jgi:hypothetical protein
MKRKPVSEEERVQRQIKALQKRIRGLEYEIYYIRLQLPKPQNPIGFKIPNHGNTEIS